MAATNVDLRAAVTAGKFREDLYYRLNVVTIELPPLRERSPENLTLLTEHFLRRLQKRGLPAKSFTREALARMARYAWPGNVRELEHLVEQLVVTTTRPVIDVDDLPPQIIPEGDADEPFRLRFDLERPLPEITLELTERAERAYLVRVLEKYRGRIDRCASHSGLSRRSISEKLRRYGIDKAAYKPHTSHRRGLAVGD